MTALYLIKTVQKFGVSNLLLKFNVLTAFSYNVTYNVKQLFSFFNIYGKM